MLRTRAPVSCQTNPTFSLDLHVLGLPLAFILSQDQTLHCKMFVWPGIPKYSIFGWLVIPYSVSFKELYKLRPEDPFIACFPFTVPSETGCKNTTSFCKYQEKIFYFFLDQNNHCCSWLPVTFRTLSDRKPFQTLNPIRIETLWILLLSKPPIGRGCKGTTSFWIVKKKSEIFFLSYSILCCSSLP